LSPAGVELVMAGVVAQSRLGARLAGERLTVADFHVPTAAGVFLAALDLDDVGDPGDRFDLLDQALAAAGYQPTWRTVRTLAAWTWCQSDTSGSIAATVKANAEVLDLLSREAC
jgi:hypothetical protein